VSTTRHVYEGTDDESLTFTVNSSDDLADDLEVELTLNAGTTWLAATWQGTAGQRRKASITITPANTPDPLDPEAAIPVYARLNGSVIIRCANDLVVHALT